MLLTAYKVTSSRNKYGDFTASADVSLACHFREITAQVDGNAEKTQSDAMGWFEADSGVVKNDIIKFQGTYYKAERVTKARKLRDPTVQFIKVEFIKYGQIS